MFLELSNNNSTDSCESHFNKKIKKFDDNNIIKFNYDDNSNSNKFKYDIYCKSVNIDKYNFNIMINICKKSQIYTINLSKTNIMDDQLIELINYIPNIKVINLASCYNLTSKSINILAIKCKKICSINLELCRISDESIIKIINNCPKLISINLNSIKDNEFNCISNDTIIKLSEKCKNIKELGLMGCCSHNIEEDTIKSISKNCLNISKLYISHIEEEHLINYVIKKYNNFQFIKLSCMDLTDNILAELGNNCPYIVELHMYDCDFNFNHTLFLKFLFNSIYIQNVNIYNFDNIYDYELFDKIKKFFPFVKITNITE
jgi:hypothetical protein